MDFGTPTDVNDTLCDDASTTSLPTALPAPPRLPAWMRDSVFIGSPIGGLYLVAANSNHEQTRVTVPALRLVSVLVRPSTPPNPPSIPPTGSTPIRRAA